MKLDNINLEIETAEIIVGGEKIHIKSYLPTAEKMDLVDALKMEVLNEPIINQPKLDALLNIFIVINYTDIEIENRDVDNLLRVYDYLEYNGIIEAILQKIPKVELDALIILSITSFTFLLKNAFLYSMYVIVTIFFFPFFGFCALP